MPDWTIAAIPDLTGKVVVVTGASSGIGEVAASVLAGRGAQVVLGVRDAGRGEATLRRIMAAHPGARASVSLVDMADLGQRAGVRGAGVRVGATGRRAAQQCRVGAAADARGDGRRVRADVRHQPSGAFRADRAADAGIAARDIAADGGDRQHRAPARAD